MVPTTRTSRRVIGACASVLVALLFGSATGAAGAVMKRTFDDEFNGTALNTANWQVMTTASTGFTQAGECYVDDPSNVSVGHGVLTLTATKLSTPEQCGPISSQYQSGMIVSKDRFAQTYGRFKARVKMPTGTGFQSAFWMWPQDMAYGRRSGEIDIAEAYGSYPDIVSPHIHMYDASGGYHSPGTYCNVADSAGRFHTYTLVWRPTGMKFRYDGATCWNLSSWNPGAPLVAPQPFNKPFFVLLQLALGYGNDAVTPSSAFPAKFVVDYVRAWR